MNIFSEIEQFLKSAVSINFYPARYEKEAPAIGLIFSAKYEGVEGYKMLVDNYKVNETTLIIFENGETLDISIVNKSTADAVNIKSLLYDKNELEDFVSKHPNEGSFAFMIGSIVNNIAEFIAVSKEVPIVVFHRYEIINRPS